MKESIENRDEVLTFQKLADQPELATYNLELKDGQKLIFRPLEAKDVDTLTDFLRDLSPETRKLSTFKSYDQEQANELVGAINKYDKLRFILESEEGAIVGIVELSFGIPNGDIERYKKAGIELNEKTDIRFGPTLADEYQSKGVGSKIFPLVTKIAHRFGKERIILWGGVLQENERAIQYYQKQGFEIVGPFENDNGPSLDMMLTIPK